jgi:heat shock protein HslJ
MRNTFKMTHSRIVLWSSLFVILSLLISACQPAPAPTEPPAPPTPPPPATATAEPAPTEEVAPTPEPTADLAPQLADKLWTLVAFGDAANPAVVEEGTVVTAYFGSDGTLSGSGGCNNYSTTYELAGDQLSVASPIASNMMFCETGMNQESAYLAALQSAGRIAFTAEGRLEIFYDVGSSTEHKMVFVPGETPLVDTVWTLETMGDPNNPTTVERGTIITAIFGQEGELSGLSGCNNYVASYTLQDNKIKIEQAISTMMACTQGMEQEAAYLEALQGAETYQIEGIRLKITYGGGAGVLVYTSRSLPLENTLWTLVSMNGVRNNIGLVPTTALFDPQASSGQGSVGGVAMCNNYNGGYTVEEDKLTVEELSSTKIRCPETVMQAETTYLELLGSAQTYQVFGQTLIITSEKGLLTYVANRASLEGTNWRLTALGPVDQPQAPVAGADFTAQFVRQPGVPSGLIVGGTGCNDYNAVYAANLDEIKINIPSRTNNPGCAAGLPQQEQQYYLALNAASSYRILGDSLQIFYGDGEVLSYTAFVPQAPPPSAGPLTSLNGTRWWLVSMRNIVLRPGSTITADFAINADGVTGTISGTGGCNTYNAPILGYFQVGPAATTKKFCAEPVGVMEQESSYLALLSTANRITQANNQLVIGTLGGLLVYYNQPVPILPIEPPATETPVPPATVTPEAPAATPEPPTAEPPTSTPEPTIPPATAVPPIATLPVEPVPPIATLPPVEPVPPIATLPPIEPMPPIATLPAQLPPQAVISAPAQGMAGEVVIFDASDSTPQGWLAGYTWNFGDGTISEGVLAEHVFSAPGSYTVTLTVVDFYGQTSQDTVTINIQ